MEKIKLWMESPQTSHPHPYMKLGERWKYTYTNNYDTRPRMGKTVEPSDGHAVFMTLFRLDASFAMAPCVLHLRNPVALDTPPVLRPKLETCLHGGFEAQTSQTATWSLRDLFEVDACRVSNKPLTPPSHLTRPTQFSSVHVLLLFSAPHGSPVTLPGLLESLVPSLIMFILHCP